MACTLNEILEQVTAAVDARHDAMQAAEAEHAETLRLIELAKADAEKAVADGDSSAYTEAAQREQYNRQRADSLMKAKVAPYYTAEQVLDIGEECRKLFKIETAPLYKRLHEIAAEWKEIVDQIDQKEKTVKTINGKLISSVGCENHRAYGSPDVVVGSHVSTLDKAITHSIRSAIEYHYKPEKEE